MPGAKTLLFVGRTRNGKSSTANSLIGEKFFTTKKDDASVKEKTVVIEGSKVTVVDGTDIGDTGSDMNGYLQDIVQKAETAVQLCESGFNALIFVMTYGTRFTKQEKDSVDLIKSLFGRDIFRRFGIIVMTRGDQFEMDTEDDPKTFDQWCKEQTGDIKILFKECDYRIVIFNNRSSNTETLIRQRQKLLSLVPNTNKYSLEDFNEASNDRQKLLISHSFLEAEKQNKYFLEDTDQQINRIMSTKETKRRHGMLTNIQADLHKQMETVQKAFEGSQYYNLLWTPLQARLLNVMTQLRIIDGGRSENTGSENVIKRHRGDKTNSQPFRRLPVPLREISKTIPPSGNTSTTIDNAYYPQSPQMLQSASVPVKHTILLLVGRSGSGKSSTANSIIAKQLFGKNGDGLSLQNNTVNIEGSKVTVVDGTGIGDSGSDMNGAIQDTIQKAETAVQLCESGFNALIFVMAYGTRYTKQEKDAVDLIKSLFGRDIFRRFGIIVMTRGDQFEMDTEDDHRTFNQWCEEQTGDIRILFQECDYRIVMFNNRSSNIDTLIRQRQNLLSLVPNTNKYSLENFNEASNDRQKLLISHSFLEAEKQNKYFLEDTDQQINRIMSTKETKRRHGMLTNIQADLHKQMETVQKAFEGSQYYNLLWTPLQTRLLKVRSQLQILEGDWSENTRVDKDNTHYGLQSTSIDGPYYSYSPQTLPPVIHLVKDTVLLLVGRTGSGKSSTANSIIGNKLFGEKAELSVLQKYAVDIEDSKVTVVDGTGIGDTGSDMDGDIKNTIQKAETAVQLCESGFNALIFVMTYGTRFTKKEKDAVDLIKSLFGRDIFRRFGVIVMTRGDQFEIDMEIDDIPFDHWIKTQTGDFKNLFDECHYKCVLFDNKKIDSAKLSKQRKFLLSHISIFNKYTLQDFQKQNKGHEDLILHTKFQEKEKEIQNIVRKIEKILKDIDHKGGRKNQKKILQEFCLHLEKQKEDSNQEFKDSIYLQKLIAPLHDTQLNLEAKILQLELTGQSKGYSSGVENENDINKKLQKIGPTPNTSSTLPREEAIDVALQPNNQAYVMAITSQETRSEAQRVISLRRQDKVILLVGRTGNGKSSTANSIVGEQLFGTKKDDFSINKSNMKIEGSKVTVVDGTGIGDTGSDMNGNLQDTIQKAEHAVQLCESGFNAIIFVMTYGTRFTKQEKDAVDLIKSLFGRDIFRRFGIIVMTRGDQFEMDTEDDHQSFDQWCEEQTGSIKDLFVECDYRKVIFNNRSNNKDTIKRQRRDLLDLVDETIKYSKDDFKLASNDRKKLLIAHDFKETDKKNQTFIHHIDQMLAQTESQKDVKRSYAMLSDLLTELEERIKSIEAYFRGTEYILLLLTPLQTRVGNVNSKMRKLNGIRPEPSVQQIHSVVKDTVLLFVGRTGNGKSSTVNSLIGERFFATRNDDRSVKKKTFEFEGSKITVVDGTGIGDTGSDMNGDLQDTIRKAETAVQLCESGFNALIFVMTYGTRFTKQEKDAVDLIKSLFGRDIFRRFGIIVMTRGDQFEMDTEDDPKTFDQWCKEQTGDIRSLFKECQHKKVLFNNRSPNRDTLYRQRQDLLNLVPDTKKYSTEDFKLASGDRHNLLLKQSSSNLWGPPSSRERHLPSHLPIHPPSHTTSHPPSYLPVITQQPRPLPQPKPPKTHAKNASDRNRSYCCKC